LWVAQLEPTSTVVTWAQFGVLGLIIVAAFFGWLEFRPAIVRMERELETVRKELADLNRFVRETAVPTLAESNELMRRVTEFLMRQG
jgi:hypothetical protein